MRSSRNALLSVLSLFAVGLLAPGCSKQVGDGQGEPTRGNATMQAPAQPAVDVVGAPRMRTERELTSPLGKSDEAQESGEAAQPIPHYSNYVLTMPDIPGVVSWKQLARVQVEPAAQPSARFDPEVDKLDAQQVKLHGFMLPIEVGEKHKRFILAALPPSCSFCLPGGPESVVEVIAREPVKFTVEPIVLAGKFNVLKSDPLGLYYRLTEARPASPG